MPHVHLPHDHGKVNERIADNMPSGEAFAGLADTFKQLGDSSRLRIFWLLCHSEECVINISALVSMSSPAVSHHLKQLKGGGFIVSRRVGKEVYYTAAETERAKLLHDMIKKLMALDCGDECSFDED